MSKRLFWFVAGSAAGVWASVKAKRAAERVSMPGLIDQASALGIGYRAFKAELKEGMDAKETELRQELLGEPQHWQLEAQDAEVVEHEQRAQLTEETIRGQAPEVIRIETNDKENA